MALVKLLLDVRGDVLFDVIVFEGGRGDVDAFLLHLLAHVYIFYDRLGARGAGCAADARVGGGYVEFLGHLTRLIGSDVMRC